MGGRGSGWEAVGGAGWMGGVCGWTAVGGIKLYIKPPASQVGHLAGS